MDHLTPSEDVVTPPRLAGNDGPCMCARFTEATPIGRAVCRLDFGAVDELLKSGGHLVNEPCHLQQNAEISRHVRVEYTLERFLETHNCTGPEPNCQADAILVSLLKAGADPEKQTQEEADRVDLMERLVNYALRPTTISYVLEHLLAVGAGRLYPGGRMAMRDRLCGIDVWHNEKTRILWSTARRAVMSPESMSRIPSLDFMATPPSTPGDPPAPIPAQHPRIHWPSDWIDTACACMVGGDPTRLLRPECGCPPGLFHMCPGSNCEFGATVVVQQPTVRVSLQYCHCGRLFGHCRGEYESAEGRLEQAEHEEVKSPRSSSVLPRGSLESSVYDDGHVDREDEEEIATDL